jgi:hypothetical protein
MMMHINISSSQTKQLVECMPAQRDTARRYMRILRWNMWLFLTVPILVGCSGSQPAIAKANVKLVEKLRAAVSAKNTDWLESTAKQIETARRQGKLSDEENAALEPIVADARGGQWEEANSRLKALINAQYGR